MTTLDIALSALDAIAPLRLAAAWDNVGLLVDPTGGDTPVRRIFLCIDLTEPVFAEALEDGADLIVAYHPIIFGGLKRLDRLGGQRRTVIDAIRQGIAIYSPHTAADSAVGGVCDWLLDAVGPTAERAAIEPATEPGLEPLDTPVQGLGRRALLVEPAPLATLLPRIKKHLGLRHLRVAEAPGHADGAAIHSVAVCPGAGGSLFEKLGPVDLLITGELRHHDVLARVGRGTSVVLTDHTNCERGWLPLLQTALQVRLGRGVSVAISARDRDPLAVV